MLKKSLMLLEVSILIMVFVFILLCIHIRNICYRAIIIITDVIDYLLYPLAIVIYIIVLLFLVFIFTLYMHENWFQ